MDYKEQNGLQSVTQITKYDAAHCCCFPANFKEQP